MVTERLLFTIVVFTACGLAGVRLLEWIADGWRYANYVVLLGTAIITCSVAGIVLMRIRNYVTA